MSAAEIPRTANIIWVRPPNAIPVAAAMPARGPPDMPEAIEKATSEPGVILSRIPAPVKVRIKAVSMAKNVSNMA
jgi:hypothetical protein